MDEKQKEDVALFRYGLIRNLLDEGISKAELSVRLDQVMSHSYQHPNGNWYRPSRRTLLRWKDAYRDRKSVV